MADPEIVVGAFETVENDENYESGTEVEVSHEQVVHAEDIHESQSLAAHQLDARIKQQGKKGAKCEVRFCPNTSEKLEEWERELCQNHHQPHKSCSCPPPFQLYAFPSKRIAGLSRESWIKVLKEDDPSKGDKWQPKSLSRVCSRHFADGEPTNQNPMPTLYISKLLTDYSQVQPVNTFIYYVGETPSRSEEFEETLQTDNPAAAWGPDGLALQGLPARPALTLDHNGKETLTLERCLETGRAIGNWNGLRLYRDYSLECWKNFGQGFQCIIPSCTRKRFNNEAFLQVPVFPTDALTNQFICCFLYVLKKFGGVTDEQFRKILQSRTPKLQICRHHFPSTGAAGESPYRSICNFVTSCLPSEMKPGDILESLTTMTQSELDECAAIYNSFLIVRYSASDVSLLSKREQGRVYGQMPADEKFMRYFELWKSDSFTDLLLISRDGRSLKAHKAYLAAISTFLRDVLQAHDQEEMTKILLIDYEYEDLVNLLLFLYSGIHYNERESIDELQNLLSDLGITVETSVIGDEVFVTRPPGGFGAEDVELIVAETINGSTLKQFSKPRRRDPSPPPCPVKKFKKTQISFLCERCNGVFSSENELSDHQATECLSEQWTEDQVITDVWNECIVCGEVFEATDVGIENAQLHADTVHPDEKVEDIIKELRSSDICDICGETISRDESFLDHRRMHYSVAVHRCTTCDISFESSKALQKHLSDTHAGDECEEIVESFYNEDGTETTVAQKVVTKYSDTAGFRCKYCAMLIVDYFEYKEHLEQHVSFSCNHCGLLFMSDSGVKQHILKTKCGESNANLDGKRKRLPSESEESPGGQSEEEVSDEEFIHFC